MSTNMFYKYDNNVKEKKQKESVKENVLSGSTNAKLVYGSSGEVKGIEANKGNSFEISATLSGDELDNYINTASFIFEVNRFDHDNIAEYLADVDINDYILTALIDTTIIPSGHNYIRLKMIIGSEEEAQTIYLTSDYDCVLTIE